ncbi:hypothetical protein [Microbacterium enclense]|uniref:Uncharacterized protein n=1 Tax=Microbacterium enclense TaxID=993073 RepID=A0A1G6RG11_9MICO|nr:hypothetical protein [Microbacterium enclense]SDD03381.1 hypothetical protein SAMN05216418_0118 [Microbacterium enclense]
MSRTGAHFDREAAEAAERFAPLGWAFFGKWHRAQTQRILRIARGGASTRSIDEALAEVWNVEQPVLLRTIAMPLGRFGRGIDLDFQRRCQQRQTLIDVAISCHNDGRYAAAIPLTLAQIDGLTRELTGSTFFRSKLSETERDYIDDSTLAGVEGNLPTVRKAFSAPVDQVGRYGSVSRHGVMHGQDLSYASNINSTKTLVLLGALIEHLEERSKARAQKWRRDRDIARSKLNGVDDNGRLHDSRGLEEMYMFRVELHSWVEAEQSRGGAPAELALERKAHELLIHAGLQNRRFAVLELTDERLAWTFQTPSGHHMGAAARWADPRMSPWSADQWTWDAPDAPSAGPWNDAIGWTEWNGEAVTPNWRFDGFYTG